MQNILLTKDYKKLYISSLIPTVLAMIAGSVYVIADVAFVSINLTEIELAAFNIAMPIYTVYSCVSLLFGVGTSTLMSIYIGMGETQKPNQILTNSLTYVVIIGLLMTLSGLIWLDELCLLLGATEELLPYVKEYIKPVHSLSICYILSIFFQIVVRADNNPKLVMIASITGNIINIGLDYLFVVVLGLGLNGASLATGIGPLISFLIIIFHYILKKNTVKFTRFTVDTLLLFSTIKCGLGSSIIDFASGMIIFLFNIVLLYVSGSSSIAIYAIISNLAFIGRSIFNGLAQSVQPIISASFGAGDHKRVNDSFRFSKLITLGFSIVIYAGMFVFASEIMSMFIGQYEHLLPKSVNILRVYFISFIFTGLNTIHMYYYQSINDTKTSILISIFRSFVLIILGLLILVPLFGEIGVYLSITFAEVITFIGILIYKKSRH